MNIYLVQWSRRLHCVNSGITFIHSLSLWLKFCILRVGFQWFPPDVLLEWMLLLDLMAWLKVHGTVKIQLCLFWPFCCWRLQTQSWSHITEAACGAISFNFPHVSAPVSWFSHTKILLYCNEHLFIGLLALHIITSFVYYVIVFYWQF